MLGGNEREATANEPLSRYDKSPIGTVTAITFAGDRHSIELTNSEQGRAFGCAAYSDDLGFSANEPGMCARGALLGRAQSMPTVTDPEKRTRLEQEESRLWRIVLLFLVLL